MTVHQRIATAPSIQWRWPHRGDAAPAGVKILLLTKGRVAVLGTWCETGYAAWAPLPQVDKAAWDEWVKGSDENN